MTARRGERPAGHGSRWLRTFGHHRAPRRATDLVRRRVEHISSCVNDVATATDDPHRARGSAEDGLGHLFAPERDARPDYTSASIQFPCGSSAKERPMKSDRRGFLKSGATLAG